MTQRLDIEVARPLTKDELKKIQSFAETLVASAPSNPARSERQYLDVDALRGMFAGMGGDKSDKELIREAWDEIAAKYDD